MSRTGRRRRGVCLQRRLMARVLTSVQPLGVHVSQDLDVGAWSGLACHGFACSEASSEGQGSAFRHRLEEGHRCP